MMDRISQLERQIRTTRQAPTIPVYAPPPLPPPPTTATITSISAHILPANGIPPDQVLIRVCADDAGGIVPGTILGSLAVSAVGSGGIGSWTDPAAPSPSVTLDIGSTFWLWFGRSSSSLGPQWYSMDLGPNTGAGVGSAGTGLANPLAGAGFQWTGVNDFGVPDGIWYTYTVQKLATSVFFDDGNSWTNPLGGGSGVPFGRGNTNSLFVASKYIVP